MQPTYEELFSQNQVLIKQLNEALLEFRQLKEENWLLKEENRLLGEEKASVPNEAKYGFGPRLMGFITSLSGEFRLSKRQVVALVGKIGIKICSGSVCKIHNPRNGDCKRPANAIF